MSFFHVIILSIVEGITELLPVSSTAHLVLARDLLQIEPTAFVQTFIIAIQVGAIVAIALGYGKQLYINRSMIRKIIYAFIPTALVGIIIYPYLSWLLGNVYIPIITLGIGGVIMIIFEYYLKKNPHYLQHDAVSNRQAWIVGCAQTLAFIPGVSRSAATIIGGMALGISRKTIVEFSFVLALPTMIAATGYDLMQSSLSFSGHQWVLLSLGIIISAMVTFGVMKWFVYFIERFTFISFGVYRIALAIVLVVFLI